MALLIWLTGIYFPRRQQFVVLYRIITGSRRIHSRFFQFASRAGCRSDSDVRVCGLHSSSSTARVILLRGGWKIGAHGSLLHRHGVFLVPGQIRGRPVVTTVLKMLTFAWFPRTFARRKCLGNYLTGWCKIGLLHLKRKPTCSVYFSSQFFE
jgi:hypothetical protein